MSQVHWPSLPIKKIIPVKGRLEYYLKSRETSEQLIADPILSSPDNHVNYQFYKNRADKLIGYRFILNSFRVGEESLPRVSLFTSSVMASYVPVSKVEKTNLGDFDVLYHDLSIRILQYLSPDAGCTYSIIMRSKRDSLG